MLFLNEDTKYIASDSAWGVVDKAVYNMDLLVESMGIPDGLYEQFFSDDPIIMGYEILGEMNSGWDALEKDMLLCEAHAVIQGIPLNEGAFTEKMKSWWQAIKNFFAKIWAGLKDFFRKVWVAISTKFQNAERWWNIHQDEITVKSVSGVSGYSNIMTLAANVGTVKSKIAWLDKSPADNKEAYEKALEELDNTFNKESLRKLVFGEKVDNLSVTKDQCKIAITGLSSISKTLTDFQNSLGKSSQEAIKTAEEGLAKADKDEKKEESEKLSAKVKYLKKKLSIYQEIASLFASASSQSVSLAYSCAKKMYLESKRSNRPE